MQDMNEWRHEMAARLHFRQQEQPAHFAGIVEEMLEGKVFDGVIPVGWEQHMNDLIQAARQTGEPQRECELAALRALFEFTARLADKQPPDVLEGIREVLALCESRSATRVRAVKLGNLGMAAKSRGLDNEAKILMQEAVEAAEASGLRSAELRWDVNLAAFEGRSQPRDTAHELLGLLAEARRAGADRLVGIILHNLAVIHGQLLPDIIEAIRYQEEAVSIASRTEDRHSEISYRYHLAQLQERAGMTESALRGYDHALGLDVEEAAFSNIGITSMFRAAKLAPRQHQDLTRPTHTTHVKFTHGGFTKKDIEDSIKQAKFGPVVSGWDPDTNRAVSVIPDRAFAGQLVIRKEWAALAVYAYYWTVKGIPGADPASYHSLAVALPRLGRPCAPHAGRTVAVHPLITHS